MNKPADPTPTSLPLGGTTYSWLHQKSLEEALQSLAHAGFQSAEIATAAPHLSSSAFGSYERHALRRLLDQLDIRPISINPGFLDINLLSNSSEFRALSERLMTSEIELAADLGAPFVVLIPGKRHSLCPAPADACLWTLERILERLVTRAEQLGVTVALETSPYGYLGSGDALLEIADAFDSDHLGITYDCANVLAFDDPAEGVKRVSRRLKLAHVSDTWRDRWAHTSPGRGEVDFAAYAAALAEIGFEGPTIYELADMEDPDPRLADDIATLEAAGWSRTAPPVLPTMSKSRTRSETKERIPL